MQTSSNAERRLRKRVQQYLASGLLEPAKATLESLLQHAPMDPSVHQSLASVLMHLQYPDAACASLLEAARHLSVQPNIAENLTQQLMLCGQSKAAHEMLLRLDPDQVSDPAGLLSVCQAYHALGDSAAALTWMEHALASGTDTPNDHYLHGLLLEYAGRLEDAEHCFDRSVARWPQFASSALERSRLKRQSESSNHVDALQEMMAKAPPGSFAEAEFAFALSKELDDLGRYEEAWRALQRGNAIMKLRNPYLGQTDELLVDTMLRSNPPRVKATQHAAGPTPIFIVGLPRSGTTLLDRILSNHSRVTSAGEIGDFMRITQWMTGALGEDIRTLVQFVERTAEIDPMELGRRYLEQTRWRAGNHDFYVDKTPENFQLLHLIHLALPESPILYIARSPMATCFSHLRAMFGEGRSAHSYDMQHTAHYYRQQMRLRDHWRQQWPGAMLEVKYADLVSTPETSIRSVLTHCGLDFEPACADPSRNSGTVNTLSSAQVRQPIHTRSLESWKNYAAHLEPLERALAE